MINLIFAHPHPAPQVENAPTGVHIFNLLLKREGAYRTTHLPLQNPVGTRHVEDPVLRPKASLFEGAVCLLTGEGIGVSFPTHTLDLK